MDELLRTYVISVPEDCIGDVSGALNSRGAWLDEIKTDGGVAEIQARADDEAMLGFKEWLVEVTGGRGKLDGNA